jgi:two-component system, OmpR family, sensor histidine kinase KdpD
MRESLRPIGRSPAAAVAVVVLSPVAATLVSFPLAPPAAAAASVYLLAVVVAAWAGGVVGGVVGALLSATALNFFFTPPAHTLRVEDIQDVVALVVFLLVALIVGSVVARALADRARATERERETRLLTSFTTKLQSGEPLERMLNDFTAAMLDPFDLATCAIDAEVGGAHLHAVAVRAGGSPPIRDGPRVEVALTAGGSGFGTLIATRRHGAPAFTDAERRLLDACGRQAAIAIERTGLAAEAEGSRVDAEANRLRAALFSSVSHDLRTPLASIKAGVTSLLDADVTHDDAQRRELLQTILEETDRLNRVVGNILDLAKARAGAMSPSKQSIAVDEIVESVVHRMGPPARGVRFRTVLRDEVPDIWADPVQLDQVLTNLLENAARFSPRGGEVTVFVTPWRGGVQVRVTDQGPGVPVAERDRVFEPFYRRDDGHRTGSGLGLAIARAIVLAHGGRIWIEAVPAGGAAVVFELPAGERRASADGR